MRKPEPGHRAILKNQGGGRLFEIHKITDEGIFEKHSIPSQQKYVEPRREDELVFFHNDAAARVCAKRLAIRKEQADQQAETFKRLVAVDYKEIIEVCQKKGGPK